MIFIVAAAFFLCVAIVNVCCWPGVRRLQSKSSVAVLIPARNEEEHLPHLLRDALTSDATEILVYDDHSTDATAKVIRAFAALDSRVRLVPAVALPQGWAGKCFACSQLAAATECDWLLFLDADTRITADTPSRIAAEAEARRATLLSCWPGFAMGGFWERLLMPMLNFVVFSLFPSPMMFFRKDASLGLAHGACILVRREAYRRTGGHALVKAELFEDTRLAQQWRRAGEHGICLDGSALVRVRMYENFSGIWNGFLKNFYPAFAHQASYWAFLGLHIGVYLLPFVLAFWLWKAAALVLCTRFVLALRFRQPLWSVLLHPLAELLLIAIGLFSFWRVYSGHGVIWKGRAYRTT